MFSDDHFQFVLENTKVVCEPRRAIETFGTTSFRFLLVTELMDYADRVRVREGRIEAERPRLIAPQFFNKLLLDGFGEEARDFANWIEANREDFKILRYGFEFRKKDLSEHLVHDSKEVVIGRLRDEIEKGSDELASLIEGVDEGWEVCLMKFTMDLIRRSAGENVSEWQRRGLL